MKVHLIATGGAVMHNLSIALHLLGHEVSGSDDEIYNPARDRLDKYGLLPEKMGWDASRITTDLDCIILGMHAKEDNKELLEAQKLGLKIYSYPEFLYEQSKNKTRVVIGGSHGKTTITSMILHVLHYHEKEVDYMVGAQLEGFDTMVHLTEENDFIVLEGDEYLSSPIDRRPKFHLYQPNIALVSGIAWDHINVFPTFDNYIEQFRIFMSPIEIGFLNEPSIGHHDILAVHGLNCGRAHVDGLHRAHAAVFHFNEISDFHRSVKQDYKAGNEISCNGLQAKTNAQTDCRKDHDQTGQRYSCHAQEQNKHND